MSAYVVHNLTFLIHRNLKDTVDQINVSQVIIKFSYRQVVTFFESAFRSASLVRSAQRWTGFSEVGNLEIDTT